MPDEKCNSILNYLPFIGLMVGAQKMSTPLTTRLIETAIIGVLGFMGSYVMIIPRMEEKFNQLDNTVKEVKSEVKQIQRDLYMPRAIPNVQSTQQGGAK